METLRALDAHQWAHACSRAFVSLSTRTPASFAGSIGLVRLGDVGDVKVARVRCHSSAANRTRARIRDDGSDDLLFNVQLSGRSIGSQDGRVAHGTPGTGMLCQADREYSLRFPTRSTLLTLSVPRNRMPLGHNGLHHLTARAIDAGSTGMVVLRHFLSGVVEGGQYGADPVPRQLADTATDLLGLALRPAARLTDLGPLPDDTIYAAACAFLDLHHAQPDLTIDDVARDHGISRRRLDRIFTDRGDSPAARLRTIRLDAARRLLARPGPADSVTAVAHRCGFLDVTTFIRAFRRVYGETPDSWRKGETGLRRRPG
ncbi:AraC family transcriptional regulator [Gordonia McavH-238-E]|nr:AraC family transcriptional regulator [Gordonia sp. McavH-238-E]